MNEKKKETEFDYERTFIIGNGNKKVLNGILRGKNT